MKRFVTLAAAVAVGLSLLPNFKTAATQVAKPTAQPKATGLLEPGLYEQMRAGGAAPCNYMFKTGPQSYVIAEGAVDANSGQVQDAMHYTVYRNGTKTEFELKRTFDGVFPELIATNGEWGGAERPDFNAVNKLLNEAAAACAKTAIVP